MTTSVVHRISVVIPVYRGEKSLPGLIEEITPLTSAQATPRGDHRYVVSEVVLVHDCGPDRSDRTIEELCARYPFVRPVWLSRNYGQHAATLAGMASATGDWVATIDEDGQQDPMDIGCFLENALENCCQLVYARPTNAPPHGWFRNSASRITKMISTRILGNDKVGRFNSFRLVEGEVARTLAAYCSQGVYLDVGLFWITESIGYCPVKLRNEVDRTSGYSFIKLIRHFWNLILTTGVRPLRLITVIGLVSVVLSVLISAYAIYGKFFGGTSVQGWTSIFIIVAFFSGCILAALGIIAEYMAVTMGIVMGKPLYAVSTKPTRRAIYK